MGNCNRILFNRYIISVKIKLAYYYKLRMKKKLIQAEEARITRCLVRMLLLKTSKLSKISLVVHPRVTGLSYDDAGCSFVVFSFDIKLV